jgi:hypothetical protein
VAVVAATGRAQEKEPAKKEKEAGNYVKVEAKGKLATGIMAIGGETTGNTITTDAGTFELELDKKLQGQADKLARKNVIVTGTLYLKKRVTGTGARSIIKVTTLKEAK